MLVLVGFLELVRARVRLRLKSSDRSGLSPCDQPPGRLRHEIVFPHLRLKTTVAVSVRVSVRVMARVSARVRLRIRDNFTVKIMNVCVRACVCTCVFACVCVRACACVYARVRGDYY